MAFKNQAELIDRAQHRRHEARQGAAMQSQEATTGRGAGPDPLRTYRGYREGHAVTVGIFDGISMTPLPPRRDLRDHSPDGFQWGYAGSGPSQLALAICADALGDDQHALRVYQDFKRAFVAIQTQDEWEISASDVRAMIARLAQHS